MTFTFKVTHLESKNGGTSSSLPLFFFHSTSHEDVCSKLGYCIQVVFNKNLSDKMSFEVTQSPGV